MNGDSGERCGLLETQWGLLSELLPVSSQSACRLFLTERNPSPASHDIFSHIVLRRNRLVCPNLYLNELPVISKWFASPYPYALGILLANMHIFKFHLSGLRCQNMPWSQCFARNFFVKRVLFFSHSQNNKRQVQLNPLEYICVNKPVFFCCCCFVCFFAGAYDLIIPSTCDLCCSPITSLNIFYDSHTILKKM